MVLQIDQRYKLAIHPKIQSFLIIKSMLCCVHRVYPSANFIHYLFFGHKMKSIVGVAALFTACVFASPFKDTNAMVGHADDIKIQAPSGCYWSGTAPFCSPSCDDGYTMTNEDSCGDGHCCLTGHKNLCCKHT